MVIWGALLIPILAAVITYVLWRHLIVWWEPVIPLALTVVVILILRSLGETSVTRDVEYWGGWATDSSYYEPWDERVSCSHSYRCNCYTTCSGSGTSRSCTEHCSTCYLHPYDVDYHPARWALAGSNGETFVISKTEHEEFVSRWGVPVFIELNRRYHSIDGNKYTSVWPQDTKTLESVTTPHYYENRVQASDSIFKYDPDLTDKVTYQLYDYPTISNWKQEHILGVNDPPAQHELRVVNALLGRNKQVRVYVLIFRDKPLQAGIAQQAYWMGGNKNEFIVTIGVDNANNVMWVYPFSWTEREDLKVETRNYLLGQKKLNLTEFSRWLRPQLLKRWDRKQFADFSYLRVEPPTWSIVVTYLVSLLVTVTASWWALQNDYKRLY